MEEVKEIANYDALLIAICISLPIYWKIFSSSHKYLFGLRNNCQYHSYHTKWYSLSQTTVLANLTSKAKQFMTFIIMLIHKNTKSWNRYLYP